MSKKSIKECLKIKREELIPLIFAETYEFSKNEMKRENPFRTVSSTFYQSDIYCLRTYKDGINISAE